MCAQPAVREMLNIVFSANVSTLFWGPETLFVLRPKHLLDLVFFLSYQFTWSIKSEAWIFGFPLCSLPGAPSNQSWWFWQDSGCFFEAHHGKPKEITWPWVGQNVPDLRCSDLGSDSQRVLLEVFGVLTQTSSFRIPHWWNSRLISPHEF